jgi:hypothetical protein
MREAFHPRQGFTSGWLVVRGDRQQELSEFALRKDISAPPDGIQCFNRALGKWQQRSQGKVYEQVVTGHTNGGIGECTLTGACAEARSMPVLRILNGTVWQS